MDKELKKTIGEGIEVGQRIAVALETLVNEPLVEIKTPFPQCPHCGEVNPEVHMNEMPASQGKLSEYVVECRCVKCKNSIYGVIVEWSIQPDREMALMVGKQVVERMKANNG